MFGLFGKKKSVEGELVPELGRFVVQIQETTGVSYLAIAEPMLTFGVSLRVHDKGAAGLAEAINAISEQIELEQRALGSLGSSIMDVEVPGQPKQQYAALVDRLGEFANGFLRKGYTLSEVGGALVHMSGVIAKAIDKGGLLNIGLLRRELASLRERYRREQFRQTASGETCTDEAIAILRRAEAAGYKLTVENDRTFVLSKGSTSATYLRSNSDIKRFGSFLQSSAEIEEVNRPPFERLIEKGHKGLREQNLEAAISAFSAALRINPKNRDAYFQRGVAWSNSYYNKGKKTEDLQNAIDDYTQSLAIDPEFAEGYFQRAGLLADQEQVAAAISDYGKAIEHNHKVSSAYYCRGLLWQRAGETGKAEAIADFASAIETGDKDDQFMALLARADAHIEFEDFQLALDDLNAADAYYPEGPPGLYESRASVLVKLGRTREAIVDFDRGIAAASSMASPDFIANMYEQRGQCRMQVGETQASRQDFERAAQLRRSDRRR